MPTRLISVGLPPISSVSIAGTEVRTTGYASGPRTNRQIDVDLARPISRPIVVALSTLERKEFERVDLRLQPPSWSQRRIAKRRGWAPIKVEQSRNPSNSSVLCYWVKSPGKADCLVLCARPDTADFMARQPDDTSIADLALLGTHDTCAFYGYPVSQCQQPSTTLTQQLLDGVRFLDIRCQVIKGGLHVYHGSRDQRSTFQQVLSDLVAFLTSYPSETVILSVKDEVRHDDFSRLVWLDMAKYQDMWFLDNRVPTLGEVRGKAILLSRFWTSPDDDNWEEGRGWRVPGWAAPAKDHVFELGGMKGRLQDWYTLSSFLEIPEKMAMIARSLSPRQAGSEKQDDQPILTISFASASGFPLSPPSIIAKGFGWPAWHMGVEGVNSRLEGWLVRQLAEEKRIKGIVPMDFYRQTGVNGEDGRLRELLVLMNEIPMV